MAKRIVTKIGDIFCVEIDNEYKCFFQYVANDMSQLNSSVIRVFSRRYPLDYEPNMDDIIKDDVYFCAHTVLRWGIMYNAWYKVGKHLNVGNPNEICFRWCDEFDYSKIDKSYRWYVWMINKEYKFIGELTEEYNYAYLGIVLTYDNIVNKIKTGKFLLKHVD